MHGPVDLESSAGSAETLAGSTAFGPGSRMHATLCIAACARSSKAIVSRQRLDERESDRGTVVLRAFVESGVVLQQIFPREPSNIAQQTSSWISSNTY